MVNLDQFRPRDSVCSNETRVQNLRFHLNGQFKVILGDFRQLYQNKDTNDNLGSLRSLIRLKVIIVAIRHFSPRFESLEPMWVIAITSWFFRGTSSSSLAKWEKFVGLNSLARPQWVFHLAYHTRIEPRPPAPRTYAQPPEPTARGLITNKI
jgi:hypothetical protein